MDDGNGQGRRAGFDPVSAELVAVAGMDWLYGVTDVVEKTVEGVEIPAGATKGLPDGSVMGEGTKRNESIVGGAAAEDFGSRMADVRVTYMSSVIGLAVLSVLYFHSLFIFLYRYVLYFSQGNKRSNYDQAQRLVTYSPFGCSVVP